MVVVVVVADFEQRTYVVLITTTEVCLFHAGASAGLRSVR